MRTENSANWLYLSIYYPVNQWYILLQKGIIPFLNSNYYPYINNCILHFGQKRGSYIGISCDVSVEKSKDFICLFQNYFANFFKHHFLTDDTRKPYVNSVTSIFMDFPTPSVYHSLHQFIPLLPNQDLSVWHNSSFHLTKVFGNDIFDQENLFSAALYLNLLILLFLKKDRQAYIERQQYKFKKFKDAGVYKVRFFENREILEDILKDCENIVSGSIPPELEPIADWVKVFYLSFNTINSNDQIVLMEKTLITIRVQLGLPEIDNSIIDFFITQLLKQDNYTTHSSKIIFA